MKQTSANSGVSFKKYLVILLTILSFSFSQSVFAHSVDSYSGTCASGPQYKVTAVVSNVNSTSNYRWQWKNASNAWVCFVNGANIINGNTYDVTGAVYNLTTTPGPIVFTNPNSGLQGLEIRMVISDGNGVNPCTLPAGNTWTSTNNHFINISGSSCGANNLCPVGGINLGSLTNYLFVFTNGATDANWQSASKGFIGNVAVDGIQASERTSGSFAYAGTIYSNDASLNAWSSIVSNNSSQAFSSLNQASLLTSLETDLNNVFTQINALPVTAGYNGIAATALNGLNRQNSIAETFIININSGFSISSKINITGDANDVFILRWDTDMNFGNGYQGQVKFQSGGAIVPLGGLKPSNFISVAGDINASGGGANPPAPYPQGPRFNNGTGSLISGGADFSGGGFFTGYWFTTGDPVTGETAPLSNGIFVGGWYSKTTKFSMTSGTSGVYVAPVCGTPVCSGRVTSLYFNELNNGPDLPITNGATFTIAQLGSLYNLEAGTSGTIGSIKYTITGPTPTSNIENATPYNSPGTGSGAWTGAVGTYTVNLKTYSAADATGTLCHDTTITFNLTSNSVSLGNQVFIDRNDNGIYETVNGETGYDGAIVKVYADNNDDGIADGTALGTRTTSGGGFYNFTGLPAGKYFVQIESVPGWMFKSTVNGGDPDNDIDNDNNGLTQNTTTAIIKGGTIQLTVGGEPGGGNANNTYDFGFFKTNGLGDFVFLDTDADGIQDAGEVGIAGVTVQLRNTSGALLATTTTNSSGYYFFYEPAQYGTNNYNIQFVTPAGYTPSPANQGGDDSKDSDPIAGIITNVNVPNGTWNHTFDAGFTQTSTLGSIGDRVWLDANGNGIQDATETGGITGVVVQLRNSVGTVIATQNTNGTGNYLFTGLPAGTYTVAFPVSISGAVVTTQNVGTNDDIDSDPSQASGITGNIVLATGQSITNVDAGYCPVNLQLGNRVWYDTNNNGINDAAENGIRNITVRLYKDDNNDNVADGAALTTVLSDVNGNYLFSNLAPGNYIVGAVVPNGYVSSSINGGDPDNNIDLDDNGQVVAAGNEIRGLAITLTGGAEPTSGNTNNTYDFGMLPDCACVNSTSNLLVNPSFENGTTGWSWSGGTLTTGTGYIACGAANGFNNWSAGTSKVWQDVTVAAGSTVLFSAFAGTHAPGIACSPKLSLVFLNSTNTAISQTDVTVTRVVGDYNDQLEQYSITAVAPAGTVKVRVQSTITCNTMKLDAFCLTVTAPPLGSIGDRVWNDTDGDGIQDAGEVGVAGVTVVLLNAAGQPIATTTTDAFGNYKFSGLPAGNYSARVTPPANYTLSAKTQGADTNVDSDFDPITYTTGTVTLAAGQNRTDIDAGLKFTQPQPASVGDRVWLDNNGDGVQDAGEPGVSNVLVTLYNSSNVAVRYTYTDVNGNYLFTDVTPGAYTVGFSLPPAFVFSPNNGAVSVANNSDAIPATGRTASFTVNAGDQIRYVDAGLKTQVTTNGSVGDFVWNDLNKNGIQEAGEPGIAGVTVRLVNATTNTIIATTTTDVTGKYIFNDLPAGDYKVEFVTPAGYTVTTKLSFNPQASNTDSDVDATTSRTATFTLNAGQRIVTVDAGYWLTTSSGTGKIGDRVWLDANQNGVQDAGEANVQGMTVVLYDAANVAIRQTVTDGNGNYLFTDLAAGNYTVGFSNVPQGFTFTTQGLGTAATGSDANPATGRTGTITLAAGQTNLDVDAGIRSIMAGTASIGNRVWNDLNNNGIQDAGEPGIQGITVELLDAAGNPIDSDPVTPGVQPTTRVTNALGEYLFTGLPAGDYRVRFSNLPAGFNASPKGAGTNRDVDSDGNAIAAGTSTTDVVSVSSGEERLDIDFGLNNPTAPLGQLGDRVWFDSNNNGVQDATEQGVPGVTVSLLNASNTVIATTVTDANGEYRFVNLADATYSVKFSNLPAGFVFSPKDLGGNDNTDSDADQVTGQTGTYTIAGGNTNITVDAGIYSTRAALGDYVWFDADSDGTQDATEKGIAGITVTLYDAANVAVTSAITDQNGRYFFSNLNPGTYTVGFSTIPTKLAFTLQDVVAAGDAADSDVDPATGRTGSYTLVAGQVNLTVDAGLKPFIPATVGDFVWYDLNRDGIQDAGEPGVPGVIATLYNAASQPIGSAVTDGNGAYLISNVPAGTGYYVVFSNQPDPSAPWTLQNVGGVGANNNSKADATGRTTPFNVAEGDNIRNIDAGIHKLINIYGNVWNDANGLTDLEINKTGTQAIPNSLNIYLVDAVTNEIIQAESILTNGTYSFLNVDINKSYKIVLSSVVAFPGQQAPLPFLPSGWQRVGENLGAGPLSGSDGVPNGLLFIDTETSDVIDANFGIRVNSGEVIVG